MGTNSRSRGKSQTDLSLPWLPSAEGPTDSNISAYSSLESEDSEVYSQEWLQENARAARAGGFIKLYYLVFILANDERLVDILKKLWVIFDLDKVKKDEVHEKVKGQVRKSLKPRIPQWRDSDLGSPSVRAYAWYWIIWRWVAPQTHYFEGLRWIKALPVYRATPEGELEPIGGREEKKVTSYVKLDELAEYLRTIEHIHEIEVPLPLALFPKDFHETRASKTGRKDEYVFLQTGPTWRIVFNGKELIGLRSKGFAYFHFLMEESKHRSQPMEVVELYQRVEGASSEQRSQKAKGSYSVIDTKALNEYRIRLKALPDEIEKAKQEGVFQQAEELEDEKEFIESELKKQTKPGGALKAFSEANERIRERVRGQMRRALKEIKPVNTDLYNHFLQSFRPLNSTTHSYHPIKAVPWILD